LKYISHRGNLRGSSWAENSPWEIERAIRESFLVEIDLWKINNHFYLGHSTAKYLINEPFLTENKDHLLIHAKNINALLYLKEKEFHYFWHENDRYTLTSQGIILAYPGMSCPNGGLAMKCEEWPTINPEWWGICSDRIMEYK
jgi:hypothetical protein